MKNEQLKIKNEKKSNFGLIASAQPVNLAVLPGFPVPAPIGYKYHIDFRNGYNTITPQRTTHQNERK